MKGQPGTDYGKKGETGEKEPKGAKSADSSGERHGKVVNGVYVEHTGGRTPGGKETGEYNEGRTNKVCYTHKRIPHAQD